MQTRNDWALENIPLSFKVVYKSGSKAPPAIPMINNADPVFVNLPNPFIAKGKIAGHIKALANPSKAMNVMEAYPLVTNTAMLKIIPSTAETARAFCCEINFGIVMIPIT